MEELYEAGRQRCLSARETVSGLRSFVVDVCERNAGLLLISVAQLFFVSMNTTVKMLASLETPVPTTQLIAIRMVITLICSIGWMTWAGIPHPVLGPPEVRSLLLLRGFIGFVSLYGLYNGLHYLSLSDATIITFLSPSLTALEAWLFLKEAFPRREAVAGLVSLLGVIFIARPEAIFGHRSGTTLGESEEGRSAGEPTNAQRLLATAVSLFGVIMGSAVFVVIRLIGSRCHPMHTLVYFALNGFIGGLLATWLFRENWTVPSLGWLGGMLLVGVCGFAGQYLVVLGLQREAAGRGALGEYTQIIFALVVEQLFFHALPSPLSLVGGSMIISSALYVVVMKPSKTHNLARTPPEEEEPLASMENSDECQLEEGIDAS